MPALRRWHGRPHSSFDEMCSLTTPVTGDRFPCFCLKKSMFFKTDKPSFLLV